MSKSETSTVPCHDYTSEWIERQVRKHKNLPEYQQPRIYRYAVGQWDEARACRELTERWVDELPPATRVKVIGHLRSEKHDIHTFNELRLGNSMRQRGYVTEYEPDLGGQTPDWLVRRGAERFLIECLTSNPTAERARCEEGWQRFAQRLETIQGPWIINMRAPRPTYDQELGTDLEVFAPEDGRQKQVVNLVRSWLVTEPTPGDDFEVDGMEVVLLPGVSRAGHVRCALMPPPFLVDADPLTDAIHEKVKKYGDLATEHQLPLIVAVAISFGTGRDQSDLHRALIGRSEDKIGLFKRYPILSAVTLAHPQGLDGVTHYLFPNPDATHPLVSSAFQPKP
jgi:hypothetical protein